MDVARLTVLKGLSISQTHGFCHFFPVKSEATPTQQKFKPLHKYADVIKNQTDIPITKQQNLNSIYQNKFKSRKIRLGFHQNRSPKTFQ